ncbi:AraC-like DNA-binding protein [Nonomuraea polychroma]|uniref:AraC-like DNA-binding protein n=1 Tax=Nonomuraea polychroma TaxID=46176 RepID=A0A438MJW5_9ACTN|nr:AraC-like DNA-binding protein [Nonomuraea polychroma]
MDVLSQVIDSMRSGRPRFARIAGHGVWGGRLQPVAGVAFHVMLRGACTLIPSAGDPVALGVGDVVLLPNGHGHGVAESAGAELEDVPLMRGDEFRLEPQTISLGSSGRPVSAMVLSGMFPVDDKRCHPIINDLPDIIHLPAQLGHEPPLRNVIDLLGGELDKPGIGTESAIGSLLDALLLFALRAWYGSHGAWVGWGPALNDRAISHVLCRINNDPGQPWTVHGLGAEAGLSRSAFARRFTTLVGRPPLGYLTWVRMNAAAQTLRESDEPLETVARKVGYGSEYAFAAAFKRHFGTAPGNYRRQNSTVSKGA